MQPAALTRLDVSELSRAVTTSYANFVIALVNDHVVKLSVMTERYSWHYHPNSDETFMTLEGILVIELETDTIELLPGQLFTIPKNVVHRTWPKGERSVNITVEYGQLETIQIDR